MGCHWNRKWNADDRTGMDHPGGLQRGRCRGTEERPPATSGLKPVPWQVHAPAGRCGPAFPTKARFFSEPPSNFAIWPQFPRTPYALRKRSGRMRPGTGQPSPPQAKRPTTEAVGRLRRHPRGRHRRPRRTFGIPLKAAPDGHARSRDRHRCPHRRACPRIGHSRRSKPKEQRWQQSGARMNAYKQRSACQMRISLNCVSWLWRPIFLIPGCCSPLKRLI